MILDMVLALIIFFYVLPVVWDVVCTIGGWMVMNWKWSIVGLLVVWALVGVAFGK